MAGMEARCRSEGRRGELGGPGCNEQEQRQHGVTLPWHPTGTPTSPLRASRERKRFPPAAAFERSGQEPSLSSEEGRHPQKPLAHRTGKKIWQPAALFVQRASTTHHDDTPELIWTCISHMLQEKTPPKQKSLQLTPQKLCSSHLHKEQSP